MTVKLKLFGQANGDFGGIGMVGHDYGYIGVYYENGQTQIRTYIGKVTAEKYLGEAWEVCIYKKEVPDSDIWLRLCIEENKTYRFSYSADGKDFQEIEAAFDLNKATWTGAKLCLWACARENQETDGFCDYAFVEII